MLLFIIIILKFVYYGEKICRQKQHKTKHWGIRLSSVHAECALAHVYELIYCYHYHYRYCLGLLNGAPKNRPPPPPHYNADAHVCVWYRNIGANIIIICAEYT